MLWSLGTSITGPCAAIIEDLMPKARSSKQEKPLQWEVSAPQLEKSPDSNEDSAQPKINKK